MARRYLLAPGMVVQGGADATRPFYKAVRDGEARLVIVNVARRTGEADVQLHGPRAADLACVLGRECAVELTGIGPRSARIELSFFENQK